MKKLFKITSVILILAVMVGLVSCKNGKKSGISAGYQGTVNGVTFELSDMGKSVNLHSELQNEYLEYINEENGEFDDIGLYARGITENSLPAPVHLEWTATAATTEIISSYTVNLSENKDMSSEYSIDTTETELDVFNLKIATTYYWTVTAYLSDGYATSGTAYFTTSYDGPRNLYVDGITNVRDIGGYDIGGGKKVKQGLLYRCGRLNKTNDPTPTIEISDDGIQTMKKQLGVKTEIDLRWDEEAGLIEESPLGSDVGYYRICMSYSGNILNINSDAIVNVFEILAKEENYPMIFHCSIGTDRTGVIAFLVNGLLGVSEDDLCLDYVWSNFGHIGSSRRSDLIANTYLPRIKSMKGRKLKDKFYNYLLNIGVSSKDLNSIISILA